MENDDDAHLRTQLLDAKETILRQLAILSTPATMAGVPAGGWPPDNRGVIAELRQELGEIEDCLKSLDAA